LGEQRSQNRGIIDQIRHVDVGQILVVDDDKTLTRLIRASLEDSGYDVVVAHDGDAALGKLQQEHPDLIILDVVMPRLNGYSFLFEMRKVDVGAQTPVIVLTCKEDMEDIFKVEGVREYLIKPFPQKTLVEMVRKHLEET
jgi:DNA-binding response OmpR family regulator